MKRERTTNGTWIYTARVRGRLLVSEDADRKEAFFGMIELIRLRALTPHAEA